MKNIIIEVPRNGASVQLVLRAGASSGQAVIVASDDVEIRLAEPAPAATPQPKTPAATNNGKTAAPKAPAHDLDAIFKRLTKLKPTKRATTVNSIKAMFQFDALINDDEANKILEALRRRGNLTIDANYKLQGS
jgi:cell division septation protein DedD